MLGGAAEINRTPLKMVGQSPVRVSDIGEAKDSQTLQYNVVRVNGQRSVYLPILKQGGDSNTIAVVEGVREKARQTGRHTRLAADFGGVRPIGVREECDRDAVA